MSTNETKMTVSGTITQGNYSIRRTNNEDWLVTCGKEQGSRIVGYAPDLLAAEALIAKDGTHTKDRLAELEEKASQR